MANPRVVTEKDMGLFRKCQYGKKDAGTKTGTVDKDKTAVKKIVVDEKIIKSETVDKKQKSS